MSHEQDVATALQGVDQRRARQLLRRHRSCDQQQCEKREWSHETALNNLRIRMEVSVNTLALTILITATLALVAQAETVNFDTMKAGAPPAGWTATKTGTGDAKWTIEADSTAPSKPNVLKQSGQATYPVCIK